MLEELYLLRPALLLLTVIALVLASFALLMWVCLLCYRVVDNARRRKVDRITDEWLSLLLPVLEGAARLETLPRLKGKLEMEAVLGLLRDLAERFRGQYRDGLQAVLQHIGAEEYGTRLLHRVSGTARMRGCALMSWLAPSTGIDAQLGKLLEDPLPGVRLEAAHALAARRTPAITLQLIMLALRGTGALESERARDIVRLMAPGRSQALWWLLDSATDAREKVLLLEGIAVTGDIAHAEFVATFLKDAAPQVRAEAVRTLELLGDPVHIEAVIHLARDADARVRLAVARFVASMNGDVAAMAVLEMFSMDRDFEVRRVAVHALAAWGGVAWEHLGLLARQDALLESIMREIPHAPPSANPASYAYA